MGYKKHLPFEIIRDGLALQKRYKPYDRLPTLDQWKKDSCVGPRYSKPRRRDDPLLQSIDQLVAGIHKHKNDLNNEMKNTYYANLFFSTMYWNNNHSKNSKMESSRRDVIMKLMLFCGNQLAHKVYNTRLNLLAKKLQDEYGKELSVYGKGVPGNVLERAFRRSFKITIKSRKAWRFDCLNYTKDTELKQINLSELILVNTSDYYKAMEHMNPKVEDKFEAAAAGIPRCGYVMSMSHELYLAPFSSFFDKLKGKYPKFHSDFMANIAVLCSGTIGIKDGEIVHLDNDSGHYKPPKRHLKEVVNHLKMLGMNIKMEDVRPVEGGKL